MTQLSTKTNSLVTTPITASNLNASSEPVEILNFNRTFDTTLAETVAALGHVALPTAGATTPSDGYPGELLSSTVLVANVASLTTATPASLTHIDISAGDWEITGNVTFVLGSSTCTQAKACSSLVDNTHALNQYAVALAPLTTTASAVLSHAIPARHIQVAVATPVYLVAEATFSAGTVGAYCTISARRAS
jgi:hypothetical protein